MPKDDASSVYGGMVADIISSTPRESTWRPDKPVELYVKNRHMPKTSTELDQMEKRQLERMWRGEDIDTILRDGIEDMPADLEIAIVVDEHGTPLYRLFGWNFGCVYLMEADSLECVAFAAQHDLEHWHADQRAIFWAMDRAIQRGDHGFQQPMKFCWWEDKCWAEIADKPRGTVQSEPYVRKQFAGEN